MASAGFSLSPEGRILRAQVQESKCGQAACDNPSMVQQFDEGWRGADGKFYGSADEARASLSKPTTSRTTKPAGDSTKTSTPRGELEIDIAEGQAPVASVVGSITADDGAVVVGSITADTAVTIVGQLVSRSQARPSHAKLPATFDVVISYAGADVGIAETLAYLPEAAGVVVFFDRFYRAALWGRDLAEVLDDIYRKRSRYCVMLVSAAYADRVWTTHEKRSALARDIESRDVEYILPIRIDHTLLPGLRPTVSFLSMADMTIESIADLLLIKLRKGAGV